MELIISSPRKKGLKKLAAYGLPKDPSLWQADILKKLVSDHPYIPANNAQVIFRKVDPSKGAAVGAITLDSRVSIPILISTPAGASAPKLESMDVFYYKGKYRPLTRSKLRDVLFDPKIGEPMRPTTQSVRGSNPYIGDVTGDATPLEFTGQPSPFAGPYDAVKLSSAMYLNLEENLESVWTKPFLTKISVDENSLAQLKSLLKGNPGILHAARGHKDLLQRALRKDPDIAVERVVPNVPAMVQVVKDPIHGYMIKFQNGPLTKTSIDELRTIFRDRLSKILSIVDQHYRWVGIENIVLESYSVDMSTRRIKPIRTDGYYVIATQDGGGVRGHVIRVVVTPDGQPVNMRLFVGDTGSYGFSDHMYGRKISDHNILPVGRAATGKKGIFIHYTFGSPVATVPVRIDSITLAGKHPCFLVSDLLHGKDFALIPLDEITDFAPSPIVPEEIKLAVQGRPVVYIPQQAVFTEVRQAINIAQSLSDITKVSHAYSDIEPKLRISLGGGLFSVHGEVWKKTSEWPRKKGFEQVEKDLLDETGLYEELVGRGVRPIDIHAVVKTCQKKGEVALTDLASTQWQDETTPYLRFTDSYPETKAFVESIKPHILKEAAETQDKDTLDAALSLEMLSPENIQVFLDCIGDFEQVSEKLANLLVVSRLGLTNIDQASVKKAMLGITETVDKLKTLQSQTNQDVS